MYFATESRVTIVLASVGKRMSNHAGQFSKVSCPVCSRMPVDSVHSSWFRSVEVGVEVGCELL